MVMHSLWLPEVQPAVFRESICLWVPSALHIYPYCIQVTPYLASPHYGCSILLARKLLTIVDARNKPAALLLGPAARLEVSSHAARGLACRYSQAVYHTC